VARKGGREMHTGFRWENLREKESLKELFVDERIILKCVLKKYDGSVEAGFMLFRIGTNGQLV
jgi:hypothetical protein